MTTSAPLSSQQCAADSSTAVQPAYSEEESFEDVFNDIKHEVVAFMSSLRNNIHSSHEASLENSDNI